MNYLECLSIHYPELNVVCYGDPTDYAFLVIAEGQVLPIQVELDAWIFSDLKIAKVSELSQACQAAIILTFTSDALGSVNVYDSDEVDQLNIIGAVSATSPLPEAPEGSTMPYAVREVIGGIIQPKAYVLHTHAQLRKVLSDGAFYKLGCLQKFNAKRDYVNGLTTTEAVTAVTWDSVP